MISYVSMASLGLKWLPWIHSSNAGFRANSAIFLFFFPSFCIMDSIQGRNRNIGLDENTSLTCIKHLSNGKLNFVRVSIAGEEVRRGYPPHLPTRVFISGYANMVKNISTAFYKLPFVSFSSKKAKLFVTSELSLAAKCCTK